MIFRNVSGAPISVESANIIALADLATIDLSQIVDGLPLLSRVRIESDTALDAAVRAGDLVVVRDGVDLSTDESIAAIESASVGDVASVLGQLPPVEINPTPGSNAWTDVPGGTITVVQGEGVSGRCVVRCYAGSLPLPSGGTLEFAISNPLGSLPISATWGTRGGPVSGFQIRIDSVAVNTAQVQFRRRGNSPVSVQLDLSYDRSTLP